MTERQDRHIAPDEEMLTRFVLGRMSVAEASAVEEHLASCDGCLKAVQRERLLAAGTRRLGRDQLKDSLRRRVREMPDRAIPWPGILSAAAAVGILFAVTWYNDWFAGQRKAPEAISFRDDRPAPELPAAITPPGKEKSGAPEGGRDLRRQEQAEKAPAKKTSSTDGHGAPAAVGDVASGPAGTAAAAPKDMYAADQRGKASPAEPSTTPAFWVEGVQLGAESAVAAERDEERLRTNSLQQKVTSGEKQDLKPEQTAGGEMRFRIDQRSSASLPRDRQTRRNAPDRVQTRVEQRGDMTILTLYLDSPLNERDAAGARVQTVADDSIVVTAGSQRIGLKLPADFPMRQQSPAK